MSGQRGVEDAEGVLLDGDDTQLGLRFLPTSARRSEPSRMHIHLTERGCR
jgi:hypothetical protein